MEKQIKRVVIYGLGARFNAFFVKESFVNQTLKKLGYRVVGFLDRDKRKTDTVLVYNEEQFQVTLPEGWTDFGVDVIVTSNQYFNDIRNSLCSLGFRQEQVISLEFVAVVGMNYLFHIERYKGGKGIEIGGPSALFRSIYHVCGGCDDVNFSENTVWWEKGTSDRYTYEGRVLGKVHIADATDLSILPDSSYDFVLSSNNLEHIANPIKAVKEFYRILKKDGVLVVAVPMKIRTFDHNRNFTLFEHLLDDYKNDRKEDDLSHLPEIVKLHDYSMDVACGGKEAFIQRAALNYDNRCLHHHVFDENCLKKLYQYFNLEVLEFTEIYNNYLILGKK